MEDLNPNCRVSDIPILYPELVCGSVYWRSQLSEVISINAKAKTHISEKEVMRNLRMDKWPRLTHKI